MFHSILTVANLFSFHFIHLPLCTGSEDLATSINVNANMGIKQTTQHGLGIKILSAPGLEAAGEVVVP